MGKRLQDMEGAEARDFIAGQITEMDRDLEAIMLRVIGGRGETRNLLLMKGIVENAEATMQGAPLVGDEAAIGRAAVGFVRIYMRRHLLERASDGVEAGEFDFTAGDFTKFGLL